MPDSLDEQMGPIYKRIERRVSLYGCENEQDIIARLVPEGSKPDQRLQTLLNQGFPKRLMEMGLLKGWHTEKWKGQEDVYIVRRDEKGHYMKGGKMAISMVEYLNRLKRGLIKPIGEKKKSKAQLKSDMLADARNTLNEGGRK